MRFFEVYGGCLGSEIPFPELRPSRRTRPDWTLRRVDTMLDGSDSQSVGTIDFGRIAVRLFRSSAGYRYESDDTGAFHIRDQGRSILWQPAPDANEHLARMDLLNRIIPVALHAAGMLCLHGSGVVLPGGAICFLAPKFHGKSTLAMAFTARGGSLLSDDTLAVDVVSPPQVRPGVHTVRLWDDSASRFTHDTVVRTTGAEGKSVVAPVSARRLARKAAPLAALYLLAPRRPAAGQPAVERVRLDPVLAAMSIVGQSRLGELFDSRENAVVLDRVTRLTAAVPVYRLAVARDFEFLDDVVAQISGWHAAARTQPDEEPVHP